MGDLLTGFALLPRWTWIVLAAFTGLAAGSFLNAAAYRWPRRIGLLRRSRCPQCDTVIAWYDNIPLYSFLALGARCRACGGPIAWRYPVGEALTAALWALCVWRFGPTPEALQALSFVSGLILLALIDIEHLTLPLLLTASLAANGVLGAVLGLNRLTVLDAALGALGGAALLGLIMVLSRLVWGRGAIGAGDRDLAAAIGANLGLQGLAVALWAGAILGGLTALGLLLSKRWGRKDQVPYAPFLAAGSVLSLLWKPLLGPLVLGLYG